MAQPFVNIFKIYQLTAVRKIPDCLQDGRPKVFNYWEDTSLFKMVYESSDLPTAQAKLKKMTSGYDVKYILVVVQV
jgi:hypothetical protein